jgi:tripartite-type tricarboxylate transporter receptor subunit TctC
MSLTAALLCASACAQKFPAKPVRLVVPYAPGGPLDDVARYLGQKLTARWGQPVLIDNRGGSGGAVGAELVAKAPADGYTLLLGNGGPITVYPHLRKKPAYDPERALAPIEWLVTSSMVLVVHPSTPMTSVRDLVRIAKSRPNGLTYASAGVGNLQHLSMELLQSLAGIRMVHVPYKGAAPAFVDLLSGQVDLMFANIVGALPQVKAGKMRAIAVSSAKPSAALPNVPPVADGFPGVRHDCVDGHLRAGRNSARCRERDQRRFRMGAHAARIEAASERARRGHRRGRTRGARRVYQEGKCRVCKDHPLLGNSARVMAQARTSQAQSTRHIDVVRRLIAYVAGAPNRRVPTRVIERAKHHLLDTLAAMISGARLLPGRRAIDFAREQGGNAEACVIGSDIITSATLAALANGMHGHSDETDDTYYLALVHPGCSIVPAALAMAERMRADGESLLLALIAGYDVCARFSKAVGIENFRSYGHSTHSMGGMLGSAVAAGTIAKLDAARVGNLLSYTAQQLSGLSCWARDVEHVQKAFHFGGMPARNGVTAAIFAEMGFTGVRTHWKASAGCFRRFASSSIHRSSCKISGVSTKSRTRRSSAGRWVIPYRRRSMPCRI